MTEGEARDLRMRCLALAAGNVDEANQMYLFVVGAARTPATPQVHTGKTDDAAAATVTAAEING